MLSTAFLCGHWLLPQRKWLSHPQGEQGMTSNISAPKVQRPAQKSLCLAGVHGHSLTSQSCIYNHSLMWPSWGSGNYSDRLSAHAGEGDQHWPTLQCVTDWQVLSLCISFFPERSWSKWSGTHLSSKGKHEQNLSPQEHCRHKNILWVEFDSES